MKNPLVLFSVVGLFSVPALAAGPATGDFEYPELLVTPRASERLELEAKREQSRRWTTHLAVQASSLTTLVAGAAQLGSPNLEKDPNKVTGIVGVAVGGGWLLTTAILAAAYRPYESGYDDVSGMPAKSQREQLARERSAEEALHYAAGAGARLRWMSFATNAAASIYMLSNSEKKSFSQVMDIIALGSSLAPVVFRYHWQDVWSEHESYRKRIYGPIAQMTVATDPVSRKLSPALALSIAF